MALDWLTLGVLSVMQALDGVTLIGAGLLAIDGRLWRRSGLRPT